ncbi:MAG: hypothetical protein GY757_41740 [bacterium]|nr:hypothetical protein [bacterium]
MKKLQETCRVLDDRFNILNKWLEKRNAGKWIGDYLKKQNITAVGVYGLGILGERLLEELDKSDIDVVYIVDGRWDLQGGRYDGIPVIGVNLILKYSNVPMIIVTPFHAIEKIKKNLNENIASVQVKGIDEIIDEY